MMGMHSPRGVASCRGHRGALPPYHETANAAWLAYQSSRHDIKAAAWASINFIGISCTIGLQGGRLSSTGNLVGRLFRWRRYSCASTAAHTSHARKSLIITSNEMPTRVQNGLYPSSVPSRQVQHPSTGVRAHRPPNIAIYHTSVGPLLVTIWYQPTAVYNQWSRLNIADFEVKYRSSIGQLSSIYR